VELLLASGEDELCAAIDAVQCLVGEGHLTTSCERFLVVRAGEAGLGIAADWGRETLLWWGYGSRIGRV
jgi:hypothetical protein